MRFQQFIEDGVFSPVLVAIVAAATLAVTACGGGGGSSAPAAPAPEAVAEEPAPERQPAPVPEAAPTRALPFALDRRLATAADIRAAAPDVMFERAVKAANGGRTSLEGRPRVTVPAQRYAGRDGESVPTVARIGLWDGRVSEGFPSQPFLSFEVDTQEFESVGVGGFPRVVPAEGNEDLHHFYWRRPDRLHSPRPAPEFSSPTLAPRGRVQRGYSSLNIADNMRTLSPASIATVGAAIVERDVDDGNWTVFGYWMALRGRDFIESAPRLPTLESVDVGAFAAGNGEEYDSMARRGLKPLPEAGSATYRGHTIGAYVTRQGSGEFESSMTLDFDFAAGTVRMETRPVHWLELELSGSIDRASGGFRGADVRLSDNGAASNPSRRIVASQGGWGGQVSMRTNAAGEPRSAIGAFGVDAITAGGFRHVFIGGFGAHHERYVGERID